MKKNIRKVPLDIHEKIKRFKSNLVVVGCAKKFRREYITAGHLKHLGINVSPSGLIISSPILPQAEQGKYSDRNINGEIIVRKDLPKETHYNSVESPNWGDSYNGTHTVDLPYQAYPREFNPPRELVISIKCLNPAPDLPEYQVAFRVEETLDIKAVGFEKRLLENLNLLQENIGACGVEQSSDSMDDYFKSLHVSWELLPIGNKDTVLVRLFQGRSPSKQQQDTASDRYDFFEKLKAKQIIVGNSGFRRYFGALLEDDLAVFENIEYGNALYVLFNDWKSLSQRSRIELLSGRFGSDFERVIHTVGWKGELTQIIKARRNKKENEGQ